MADITSRDFVFCAPCGRSGREARVRLASVGYLSRMRALSYACEACHAVSIASLRRGSFELPAPGSCWSCAVPGAAADGGIL